MCKALGRHNCFWLRKHFERFCHGLSSAGQVSILRPLFFASVTVLLQWESYLYVVFRKFCDLWRAKLRYLE